jgi:hypothetical protein
VSKPWTPNPLWQRLYEEDRVYLHAAVIIGGNGIDPFGFYDTAKKLPNYVQYKYENAVPDLTVYSTREGAIPRYELHAAAKKAARLLLGPEPTDPSYSAWWRSRLISVKQMCDEGVEPSWATEPPVPLPDQKPPVEEKKEEPPAETPKRVRKKKAAG